MAEDELIGAVLDGRYQVQQRLAAGAMGVVYRGERVKLGRAVAIKFLHASLADEPLRRQRFEIEARAMARLDHPHCAAVIDVGLHAGMPYLVMDFIAGVTLRDALDDGALERGRAVALFRQILAGLAHAHELGIVHRDIKPANIMLTERAGLGEQVRILDFGLARLREQNSVLTMGMVIGTPSYMAPEQCTGGAIDARTDLYACGILLFEMLTGDKPFAADEPLDVLKMQLHAAPPRLDSIAGASGSAGAGSFGDLEAVVARALAKSPDHRFATAGDLAAATAGAAGTAAAPSAAPAVALLPPPPAPPRPLPRLPTGPLRIAAIVTAAIFAIGLLARLIA